MFLSTVEVTKKNNSQNACCPKGRPSKKGTQLKISCFFKAKLNRFRQFSNYILRLTHNCLTSVYKSLLNI